MLTIFENAHPPRVLRTGSHVIRDDIEKKSELPTLQFIMQRVEIILGSKLRIQRVRINDVVSVTAALARFQNRRRVDVADAELREVWDDLSRVGKGEAGVELDAVRRSRHAVHAFRRGADSVPEDGFTRRRGGRGGERVTGGCAFEELGEARLGVTPLIFRVSAWGLWKRGSVGVTPSILNTEAEEAEEAWGRRGLGSDV